MSHRNSKKSNRLGISQAKHRAQRQNPFEEEDRAALAAKDLKELNNFVPELRDLPTPPPASQRATDIPVGAPCCTTGLPAGVPLSSSDSPSELSNLKSEIPSSSSASPSELSTLNSQLPSSFSAHSATLPLDPSLPSSSSSSASPRLCVKDTVPQSLSAADHQAARDLIASKPATKAMHKLQQLLDNLDTDFLNPDQVAQLSQLLTVYAQLQNSAAVEHIMEALVQVGAGYKREPLTRELAKVLSVQDRALARAFREKEAKAKEQRRIEREAKQQKAQAAKQAREERLFNQREDHLTRKEKLAQKQLDTAMYTHASKLRDQLDRTPAHRHRAPDSQGATQGTSGIPAEAATDGDIQSERTGGLSPSSSSEI